MIKIALVEDAADIRESLGRLLASVRDMRIVAEFPDGEAAIAGLAASGADVVLVDINLPKVSGIDVIGRMKPLMPDVQFLVLTVYEDPSRIFQALAAGANGYLLKRTDPMRLLSSIRELKGGGAPMSGSVARLVVQSFHRGAPDERPDEGLSPREREILELLTEGCLYKEIAERLGIGIETVRTHVRRIYEKLHVRTRTEAVTKHLKGR